MKHWILGLVFMALAIYSGFEFGTQIASPEKNWLKIGFFGVICVAATIFYFKERVKRNNHFRERMKQHEESQKG
jgi:hypothetical protein